MSNSTALKPKTINTPAGNEYDRTQFSWNKVISGIGLTVLTLSFFIFLQEYDFQVNYLHWVFACLPLFLLPYEFFASRRAKTAVKPYKETLENLDKRSIQDLANEHLRAQASTIFYSQETGNEESEVKNRRIYKQLSESFHQVGLDVPPNFYSWKE